MKARRIVRDVLLAFVLISIGVAIGRQMAAGQANPAPPAAPAAATAEKVMVYYFHASFRCMACNAVESTADELIRTEFAAPLQAGRLEWQSVDHFQNGELADRYQVAGNMIVVVRLENGREVSAERLDQVMVLALDSEALRDYVRAAIRRALKEAA